MPINLMEKDQRQRQQALNATQSFIVQAPAGSGKTELLIQRFLTLLQHVQSPEEILAITFTKKAANEMRLRIINALKKADMEPEPEAAHAKQTWTLAKNVLKRDAELSWHLLANPNQLRIQTIDALCATITKQLPLLSRMGSQPDIADNPFDLYREAVQEVLMHVEENVEWSQSISKLLLHLDNDFNKLHELLMSLLAKRDQWLPYIHFNTSNAEINVELEQHIAMVIEDNLSTLRALFSPEETRELLAIAQFAARSTDLLLTELPSSDPHHKDQWCWLAQLLLTSTHSWRKRFDEKMGFSPLSSLKNADEKALHKEYRERLTTLIESLSQRENLRTALSDLLSLPEPRYHSAQWEILQALLDVLKIVAAQLRVVFQQHGAIDFIENTQAALYALGNDDHPTDLTLALDYRIQHILVDEFQDTSYTQYLLLEKLIMGWEPNDGRTLFVVGDPMQSIYRFREAEVGLFIRMSKNGIGQIRLTPLTLAMNFRSAAPIVEWNNQHFQHIFPSFTDIAAGAVTYSPSIVPPSTEKHTALVHIAGFDKLDESLQTSDVIARIQTIKQHHPEESIAILVRSRTHLRSIIPALKQASIAYRAVDIDPLASRLCIQDLFSLTSAMLHPADRVAWLSVLRAPWCGLTLADLFVIAAEHRTAPIFERLSNPTVVARLSDDGQERVQRIFPILQSTLSERDRQPLREWIENAWLLLGGPACLTNEIDFDDANVFFNLLNEFSEQHPSIQIELLKEKMNHLYAATQHDDNSLQIMTIHSAKGLEFDHVILPHLERKMPHDDKPLLTWIERPLTNDKMALLLAPIHATGAQNDKMYDYICRLQKIKSYFETDRLFYVAATRAKKGLYLFFNADIKEDGGLRIESGSFLEKLWPQLERDVVVNRAAEARSWERGRGEGAGRASLSRLKPNWKNPIPLPHSAPAAIHHQSGFHLPDTTPQLIGTVTHRILQQLAQYGIPWWQQMTNQQQASYIQRQLILNGMPIATLKNNLIKITSIITNVLNDPTGQWILHPHLEARSEYAVSALLDNKIINVIFDRTFIDEHGTRWIIDFKTAEIKKGDKEKFLQEQLKKYQPQMEQYAAVISLVDKRPIRLGLYFPALPAWSSSDETFFVIPAKAGIHPP